MTSIVIIFASVWFVASTFVHSTKVAKEECYFCRKEGGFALCSCEGVTDNYKIVCNKTAHDFWSLSFCSARSIELSWTPPEKSVVTMQPEALTEFPELPHLRNLRLVGLPNIPLDMSKLEYLEELSLDNPSTRTLPILNYPAKIDELVISSDEELHFQGRSFASLKSVSKITFKGHGITKFPLRALDFWLSSNRNGPKILCSVVDTKIQSVPRIPRYYDVEADVPVEDLWWWNMLGIFKAMYLSRAEENRNQDQLAGSHIDEVLPVSFGVESDLQSYFNNHSLTQIASEQNIVDSMPDSAVLNQQPQHVSQTFSDSCDESVEQDKAFTLESPSGIFANNSGCSQSELEAQKGDINCVITQNEFSKEAIRDSSSTSFNDIQGEVEQSRGLNFYECPNPVDEATDICQEDNYISSSFEVATMPNAENSVLADSTRKPQCFQNNAECISSQTETITSCEQVQDVDLTRDECDSRLSMQLPALQCHQPVMQSDPILYNSDIMEFIARPESPLSQQKLSQSNIGTCTYMDEYINEDARLEDVRLEEESFPEPIEPLQSQYSFKYSEGGIELDTNEDDETVLLDSTSQVRHVFDNEYESSSTLGKEPEQDDAPSQIGPELPNSTPKGSGNATVIVMVIFGSCGLTFAVIVLCLRHRPRKALLVPSTIDEDWIRTQTDPGSSH